jgi:hypothetical protein
MKYKLIHNTAGQETICEKVTVEGFDYYFSDGKIQAEDDVFCDVNSLDSYRHDAVKHIMLPRIDKCVEIVGNDVWIKIEGVPYELEDCANSTVHKVIATNNSFSNISQVIGEIPDEASIEHSNVVADFLYDSARHRDSAIKSLFKVAAQSGYSKAQETHPYSKEDMVEFAEWIRMQDYQTTTKNNWIGLNLKYYTSEELFQLWKSQQIKTIYYE